MHFNMNKSQKDNNSEKFTKMTSVKKNKLFTMFVKEISDQ